MKLMQISRRIVAALFILLLSAVLAAAHDPTTATSPAGMEAQHQPSSPAAPAMSGAPMEATGNSLFGHLKNPDYMHTLLNPLPVYGLSMGVLSLCVALFFRSRRATIAALVVIFVSGFTAWPVYYFGEQAYDRVKAMSDPTGVQWLNEHMARAEKLIYAFYLLAALALAGILAPLKWPRASLPLAISALALGAVTLGIGGWISYAGGHVRHAEFRFEPPPLRAKAGHEHGGEEEEMDHGAMAGKSPAAADAGKMDHGAMPGMQSAGAQKPSAEGGQPMPQQQPAEGTSEQLEASRMQLEASRLQLEASRKQLEATEAAKEQSPSSNQQPPSPAPSQDEHGHEHP